MIDVRPARIKDIPFVRELATESLRYGIMPTRDASAEDVARAAQEAYKDLETTFYLSKHLQILIAEDGGTPLGYIILDFNQVEPATGERQCFIHDLAVVRNQWGKGATHRLIQRATELSAEKGIKYLVGMVSANNERTLRIATEALGFQVERHQIVLRCPWTSPRQFDT